ncbi:hypothetical protein [Singulisphaera sp. PoT]|uniref:hypothetical protein n=1 Tax=Singulisphaera sp. PoT TaxID=3411797 RepID=UPI003BF5555B
MVREIARCGNWAGAGPLAVGGGPGGMFASTSTTKWMWIKLTSGGTGGAYAWTEQYPDSGGAWVDGTDSGTASSDPAYESNGNDSVDLTTPPVVRARREEMSNALVFTSGVCS